MEHTSPSSLPSRASVSRARLATLAAACAPQTIRTELKSAGQSVFPCARSRGINEKWQLLSTGRPAARRWVLRGKRSLAPGLQLDCGQMDTHAAVTRENPESLVGKAASVKEEPEGLGAA